MAVVRKISSLDHQTLSQMLRKEDVQQQLVALHSLSPEWRRLVFLAAALTPLRSLSVEGGKKPLPLIEHVIRVALKGTIKDVQEVSVLLDCSEELRQVAASLPAHREDVELKLRAAKCLRRGGEQWRLALVLAAGELSETLSMEDLHALEREMMNSWALDKCWEIKPLLTGNDICQILGLDKKNKEDGIRIGTISREVLDWQLSQLKPMEAKKEDCQEWVKTKFASS
mmetsp:Transcript_22138/g.72881  ORF Transcript_22138/g.72881 Transcript_22138/m.72881 type:complete len:227 (-) Transcript_22138:566-1246(-)